ncbi:hypothetical protein [Rhodococcoides fascians]|uniref:hypothetical protein n=1 Tax=Rhodococcoides fascians TaxID=1828 RepID=UPI00068D4E8B|nr:hypothetical protein [Rhodococcus fascians]
MERVWLATNYYQDPKLVGCSANTERMFSRLIAYCGSAETGGFLPVDPHKAVGLPSGKKSVDDLVQRGVLIDFDAVSTQEMETKTRRNDDEMTTKSEGKLQWKYRFAGWSNWNSQADELVKRKRAERERQKRKREKDAILSRDMSRDVTHPEKRREEENSKESSKNTHLSTAREEQPRGPAIPVDAWKLIRDIIPSGHPQSVKTDLALRAGALMSSGTPEGTVRAALELWLTKPNAGTGLLANLVSEVIKTANPMTPTDRLMSTADKRVAEAQSLRALFEPTPPRMREIQ